MHLKHQLSTALIGTSIVLVQSYKQPASALTASEVSKIAKQITVRIEYQVEGRKKQGSGFLIKKEDNKYYVVTAYHVVADEAKYILIAPDGERYTLDRQKITYKSGTDLAVVQFTSNKTYPVAKTGNSDNTTEGSSVYVAGFPVSTSAVDSSELYRFLKGEVSANAAQPLSEGYSLVYTNPTLGGMSGGPVLNEEGEVIAIHGRAETQAQASLDGIKAVSTGNNLGISVNTFLRLALLDIGVKAPSLQITAVPQADNFVLKGADSLAKRDYRGAIEALSKAIEINPKYAKAYSDRGKAYYALQEYRQAIADYTQVLAIEPKNADVYYFRGLAYTYLKEYRQAIADYTKTLELDPKPANGNPYFYRARAYTYLKEYRQAIADYTQVLAIEKNTSTSISRGYIYYHRATLYTYLKEYREAISNYDLAIASTPTISFLRVLRGNLHLYLKNYDKAISDYSQVIARERNNAEAYSNRGFGRYEIRQRDAAIEDWRRTISIDNKLAAPKLALAVALYSRGRREEALQLWRQGIALAGKVDLQVLQQSNWGNKLLDDAAKLLQEPGL